MVHVLANKRHYPERSNLLTYWDFVIIPFVSANQARDVGVDIVSATLEILP